MLKQDDELAHAMYVSCNLLAYNIETSSFQEP
jgi:hypothetical protein